MQLMFQNGYTPNKPATMGDYTIKKRSIHPVGNQSKLEKTDVSVKTLKDSFPLNDKRPLPPKPYGKT